MPELPTVLVLGGLQTVARHLVSYLLGDEGETSKIEEGKNVPLVKFIRIADKFSISPPTTYLDPAFKRCLALPSGLIEYRQVNLAVKEKVEGIFKLDDGNGKGFDYVFDLTGETRADRPEIIHFQQNYSIPLSLARQAVLHSPKAYVRLTFPFYTMTNSSSHPNGYPESFGANTATDAKKKSSSSSLFSTKSDKEKEKDALIVEFGPKPDEVRGRWWHEGVRGQGSVQGLNYVVLRVGEPFGEGYMEGQVLARLVIANIYKLKNDEMKFLHNPDLRLHTIHVRDISRAIFSTAEWMTNTGRNQANELAGEAMPSAWAWSKGKGTEGERQGLDLIKDVQGAVAENGRVIVPYFNVVDDNDTTQDKLAKACSEVFGVRYGFHNVMVQTLVKSFSKMDFSELVDDINEDHMEAWNDMMARSSPPILDTPISPFLTEDSFRKKAINLNSAKFKRITGWKPVVPQVTSGDLKAQAESFQKAGLWPILKS